MKKTKVLIYFTHKESLGHTTRTLSIILALLKHYPNKARISVFQAGKKQPFLPIPKHVNWFDLPNPFYSKLNFRRGTSNVFVPLYAKLRARYMLSKIEEIKPDVFITEFFPFGREDCRLELLPVLTYLKKRGIKIYASIGYPYVVRSNIDILMAHCDLYDKFFIHTPKDLEYDFLTQDIDNFLLKAVYKKTFNHIKEKVYYTGYVMPFNSFNLKKSDDIRRKFNATGKIMVVVSRGGGVRYPKIISHSIAALRHLPASRYVLIVAAGPSTSPKEMSFFKKLAKSIHTKNLYLFRYLEDLPSYLNAGDVSVSMAGYNTSVSLLYFKKRCVLIPSREDPETALGYCCEQISRARLMQQYIGSEVLDYHDTVPKKIADLIQKAATKSLPSEARKISPEWFTGAQKTAEGILNA